jgi:hypothetical protein
LNAVRRAGVKPQILNNYLISNINFQKTARLTASCFRTGSRARKAAGLPPER